MYIHISVLFFLLSFLKLCLSLLLLFLFFSFLPFYLPSSLHFCSSVLYQLSFIKCISDRENRLDISLDCFVRKTWLCDTPRHSVLWHFLSISCSRSFFVSFFFLSFFFSVFLLSFMHMICYFVTHTCLFLFFFILICSLHTLFFS